MASGSASRSARQSDSGSTRVRVRVWSTWVGNMRTSYGPDACAASIEMSSEACIRGMAGCGCRSHNDRSTLSGYSMYELIDLFLHVDEHLTSFVQQHGMLVYALLFAIIFAETGLVVTPFLPG